MIGSKRKWGMSVKTSSELYELPTYQTTNGRRRDTWGVLTPKTQKQVKLAIADLLAQLQLFELLRETIDRAKVSDTQECQNEGGDGTVMEIMTLLTEPFILLRNSLFRCNSIDLISSLLQGGAQ
jgi:hypothetical protein